MKLRVCSDDSVSDAERDDGKTASQWMLLARTEDDLRPMLPKNGRAQRIEWKTVDRKPDAPLWRDDFANLLRAWKKRED